MAAQGEPLGEAHVSIDKVLGTVTFTIGPIDMGDVADLIQTFRNPHFGEELIDAMATALGASWDGKVPNA